MTRVLTRADVEDLLDLGQAMACIRQAFRQQAAGHVEPWPPSLLRSGGALLRVTQGGLSGAGRMGLRVNTVGPSGVGLALLFGSPGGELLCCMAYPFAALRLAATVAIAIDLLATPKARRVGLLGTGQNALALLRGAMAVRPVTSVAAFSRRPEPRAAFAASASAVLGVPVA